MDDVDDLDELELIDQQELEEYSDDSKSGSDGDSEDEEATEGISEEEYNQLKNTVVNIATAMGGLEEVLGKDGEVEMVYILGDDCLRCLRDLRKLWRQNEDDHSRAIPRIYAEINVLQTGLLPLLLKTVDMGEKGRKVALACTDLITTITWPIDLAAEQQAAFLREDEDGKALSSLHALETAFVAYKSAVLRIRTQETRGTHRSVLSSIMLLVLLPALSKPRHQRSERDIGTISMCLHLFRNLLAIRDPMATSLSSLEDIANSKLQSDLIVELESSRILDAILMLTSNSDSKDFNPWNVVALECVYYMFAGTKPEELVSQEKVEELKTSRGKAIPHPKPVGEMSKLELLLAAEAREREEFERNEGYTRHSRFNTMIQFIDKNGNKRMAHGQAALRKTVEQLELEADTNGRRVAQRRKADLEKGAIPKRSPWTTKASKLLRVWAEKFLKLGFENLTRSVLEDVRRERPKVGDLDQARTRIMQIGNFFLSYFLLKRQGSQAKRRALADMSSNEPIEVDGSNPQKGTEGECEEWPFSLIAQWLEPWALRMAYVRCSSSLDKKSWLEYVAAIQLWTTLYKVIDALSKSSIKEDQDAAEGIQVTHFYDQAALDSAKSVLSSYKSQSFSCLRAIVAFAYMMPKMLERYSKDKDHMYVKAKQQVKKKKSDNTTSSLAEDEMEAREIAKNEQTERKFEFQKFQSNMCSQSLADGCLKYLMRWKDFGNQSSDQVFTVTQVLHRLAIKAGDLRLFFPYKRRTILKQLQGNYSFWSFIHSEAPQVETDLRKFIDYVLRKFDKMEEGEKARWGEGMNAPRPVKVFKMPAEVEIKPSRGHLDDMGIAVGLLLEKDKMRSLLWVKGGLEEAVRVKKAIIVEEKEINDEDEDVDEDVIPDSALGRFADIQLGYEDDDELKVEASTAPEVKLLCRLLGFKSDESDTHRWIWTIPADALPHELEKEVDLIEDFLRRPLETFGEKYESMVQRIRKSNNTAKVIRKIINEHGEEEEVTIKKTRKRQKDKGPEWVDNDFIEDSDEELEMVAKMIAARGEQTADDEASPSGSSHRERSQTASSSTRRTSPSSSNGTPKQKKILSKGLFLGSDDEDEDEEENLQGNNSQQSPLAGRLVAPRPAKRALVLSDNDDDDDEVEEQQHQTSTQFRKRRALLIEDDDDE